jgi:hypothetical protein
MKVVLPKVKTTWLSVVPMEMRSSRLGIESTSWKTEPGTMVRNSPSPVSAEASQTARR